MCLSNYFIVNNFNHRIAVLTLPFASRLLRLNAPRAFIPAGISQSSGEIECILTL